VAGVAADVEVCSCKAACSLKIRRVEISVAGGKRPFVKGWAHRAASNNLDCVKTDFNANTLKIGKRVSHMLKPACDTQISP
jgi:hypothetical protein